MAITASAKKAHRASKRKAVFNVTRKRTMKAAVKSVTGATDKKVAATNLASAYKAIDKAVKTGVLNKNTAARRKSALARSLKA
jgi:small subunit ribosomal protein S20